MVAKDAATAIKIVFIPILLGKYCWWQGAAFAVSLLLRPLCVLPGLLGVFSFRARVAVSAATVTRLFIVATAKSLFWSSANPTGNQTSLGSGQPTHLGSMPKVFD